MEKSDRIAPEHRQNSRHRNGERRSSSRKHSRKVLQRLAIMFFILIVALAFLYVCLSSRSIESTSSLWRSPLARFAIEKRTVHNAVRSAS